jgi:hypothetical protein
MFGRGRSVGVMILRRLEIGGQPSAQQHRVQPHVVRDIPTNGPSSQWKITLSERHHAYVSLFDKVMSSMFNHMEGIVVRGHARPRPSRKACVRNTNRRCRAFGANEQASRDLQNTLHESATFVSQLTKPNSGSASIGQVPTAVGKQS